MKKIIKVSCIAAVTGKAAFYWALLLFLLLPAASVTAQQIKTDFSFLDSYLEKNGDVSLAYDQYLKGKELTARVHIYKSTYAGKEVFISSTDSEVSRVIVYIKPNGTPVRTKIFDKKKNIRYFITYGSKTILSILKEGDRKDMLIEGKVYDMSVLGLLISGIGKNQPEMFSVQVLDHKSGDVNRVTISKAEGNQHYLVGGEKVAAVRYKINAYFLYETVLYYGQQDFPVLLYYKGPTSINFLEETSFKIIADSYKTAKKLASP